jgi:hypothetical protein
LIFCFAAMSAAAPLACASSATVAAQLPAKRAAALGSLRHRDELTGEILLVPAPSQDPNDPLNWCELLPPPPAVRG